jgi:hypothetical protein
MAQAAEHVPSKQKALSLNPKTTLTTTHTHTHTQLILSAFFVVGVIMYFIVHILSFKILRVVLSVGYYLILILRMRKLNLKEIKSFV